MTDSKPQVDDLFQDAKDEGVLSNASMQVLDVPDLGAQIQAGLGITVDDIKSSEVNLIDGTSMNNPFVPGISIDKKQFYADEATALALLIHEPLHDFGQYGFGHSGIKEIVPTKYPPTSKLGDDFTLFVDFLKNTKCDGTTLWKLMLKEAGK